ncbi:SLBB domain-containing protein [candidate division KSB1 bacterium]|nr:SLBB domain-containing protein [candidate division KSB1 bacterium]
MSQMKHSFRLICNLFILILLSIAPGLAQEYIIGPEDELEISFWQDPQLNSKVKVNQDGRIVLPIIGSLTASGLKPSDLARIIADKISIYNKSITQASVIVADYGSNKIYISGSVVHTGKYTFEVLPTLWDAILEAGGPSENASLNNVTIIRGGIEKGKRIVVDLSEHLQQGDLDKLPKIYKGDTIYIPSIPGAQQLNRVNSPLGESDMVYIYGEVRQPGNYSIPREMPLVEALAIAGGITERADLSKVRVIMRGKEKPGVAIVDLEDNAKIAGSAPFILRPNDTVIVPLKKASIWSGVLGQGVVQVVASSIAAAITVSLYRRIE